MRRNSEENKVIAKALLHSKPTGRERPVEQGIVPKDQWDMTCFLGNFVILLWAWAESAHQEGRSATGNVVRILWEI